MKKKPIRPRKMLNASERAAVVKMLRNTKNITATVNNLKATGFDISRTRVSAVARDEGLGFAAGAPARLSDRERKAVLAVLERTQSVAATVSDLRDKGAPASYWCVRSVAKSAGMNLKPGPVPRTLSKSDRGTVIACLRKTRSIIGAVAELRNLFSKDHAIGALDVRKVAAEEGIELAHAARRAATPKILKLATKLHAKGLSSPVIAGEIYKATGYAVTPQTVLKMLAANR